MFHHEVLNGIVDPSPMVGSLFYDFTYAFWSSPNNLDTETLFTAFSQLNDLKVENSRLIEEVIAQVYTRIGVGSVRKFIRMI
ncbi:conserved hypothetical protein [Bacillus pseudomycoides]